MEVDPIIRDRKKVPGSGWSSVFTSIFAVTVLLPFSLTVLLPLGLVSKATSFLWRPRTTKETAPTKSIVTNDETETPKLPSQRTYDLVLYGATGFTGSLVAKYLAKNYKNQGLTWAIVGRRRSALEELRNTLAEIDPSLAELPILEADSGKPETLAPIIADTRVVVTTAGPYDRYGTPVVALCAKFGTSYCDITGETNWVRKMIDQYDDLARKTGAKIVHFCGHDCVPWDLLTLEVSNALEKQGDKLREIRFYDEMRGEPSGGTLETLFHSLGHLTPAKSSLGFDPLLKSKDGSKSTFQTQVHVPKFLTYSREHKSWVWTWVMAMVMANCVKRSNAVNGYNDKIKYTEFIAFPNLSTGITNFVGMLTFGLALLSPISTWALRKFLPAPGAGPSEKHMNEGYLKITAYGEGEKGTKVKARIYIPCDAGYKATAGMLAESGLTLALNAEELESGGGVWTPATCLKSTLLKRLVRAGIAEYELEIVQK